ncbi:MAG: HAMP domain-containing sensor histidine kinase, partial [Bacilli bacterium]|nr:HAMP domain-containing sensor histidine kinase [Bacilli bacterium]
NIDDMKKDIRDIKVASMKLLELVDGILLSNNIDSNVLEISNGKYNINELLENVINKNKMLLSNKNVEFKTRIDELPTTLIGDKAKIKIVIDNILSNAIKYTDEGYILLDVSGLRNKDKYNLKITVTDTGKGIKDEEIDNIFDKFYRSQETVDSDIEGTGLGLSITKSLVELMDGKITVNSTEGEGTTFTITLTQGIVNDNNDVETL